MDAEKRLIEIQEKHSFTTDKSKGHHSAGIYHFKHAKYIKHYFGLLMRKHLRINNEFFVSMVYQLMLADGLDIRVFDEIPHFCQWG
ncbi:MAG: capsular biosynthesis protein, partial [Proteobacteria bacterium]|nr:capsular biosynthesis protein [Pseudomonadota bacterium]